MIDKSAAKFQRPPYLDDWKLIGITLAINVLCAVVFWHPGFGRTDLAIDTLWCGLITAVIDVFAVRMLLRKGKVAPLALPESAAVRILPKNPILLTLVLGVFSGALMAGANLLIFKVYALEQLNLPQYIAWKAVYSYWLSAFVIEFAILRLVQPDALKTSSAPDDVAKWEIKAPTLRVSWATGFCRGMIFDFGFNVAFGLLLGGTVVRGMEVILLPTPCRGSAMLIATGLTGVIVTFFVIPSLVRSLRTERESGALPPLPKRNPLLAWLPAGAITMSLTLCLFIAPLTVLVCWGIFALFQFETMNFFQFYLVRAMYIPLLCKAVLPLIVRRFRQP